MLLLQKTTDDTWIQKFGSIAHWNFSSQKGTKFNFRFLDQKLDLNQGQLFYSFHNRMP